MIKTAKMSLKVLKRPKKEYVIEFYRALDTFKGDLSFSEFSDTFAGDDIVTKLNNLSRALERNFPYLDSRNAR